METSERIWHFIVRASASDIVKWLDSKYVITQVENVSRHLSAVFDIHSIDSILKSELGQSKWRLARIEVVWYSSNDTSDVTLYNFAGDDRQDFCERLRDKLIARFDEQYTGQKKTDDASMVSPSRERSDAIKRVAFALFLLETRDVPKKGSAILKAHTSHKTFEKYEYDLRTREFLGRLRDSPKEAIKFRQSLARRN